MAFIENTLEFTVGGKGVYSGNYSYADITITTNGSKVDWKISMRCPANGSGNIPLTRIEFKIDGQTIYNKYWTNYGDGFPCKNDSSASGSITLKNSTDTSIPIIFNLGVNYKDKCQYESSKTLTRTYYTNGTAPSLSVTDKGNNTVTLSGTLGKNGTDNAIQSATLYFTVDGTDPKSSSTRTSVSLTASSGASYTKSVTITENCTVKGYTICKFKRNNTTATDSAGAKYYIKPNNPGKPIIYHTRTRLTPKEFIKHKWTAATAGNSNSPVVGYRVRLYQKKAGSSTWTNIPIWSTSSGEQKSVLNGTSTTDWIYDRGIANVDNPTDISLGHEIHGFKVGDSVKLSTQAYSKNGAGGKLLSDVMTSAETIIQNAGVVHVKVGGSWKEGQVYVKVSDTWREADSVNVKVSGSWKESQ